MINNEKAIDADQKDFEAKGSAEVSYYADTSGEGHRLSCCTASTQPQCL